MAKKIKKIQRILFITLSNVGDAILTLPALDLLMEEFPEAMFTVVTGPRPKEIFEKISRVRGVLVLDKKAGWIQKLRLFRSLQLAHSDLVVDLRNTAMGFFLGAKTAFLSNMLARATHMKDRHLEKTRWVIRSARKQEVAPCAFTRLWQDKMQIQAKLQLRGFDKETERLLVVAPSARSLTKRWSKEDFIQVCSELLQLPRLSIALVGEATESEWVGELASGVKGKLYNLCGQTNLFQLAALLQSSVGLVSCDSATMHLASYLQVPVVAIFGPTDECCYGPWSKNSQVVTLSIPCRPCGKALCPTNLECLQNLPASRVIEATQGILAREKKEDEGVQKK